jgi:hypothetical protein
MKYFFLICFALFTLLLRSCKPRIDKTTIDCSFYTVSYSSSIKRDSIVYLPEALGGEKTQSVIALNVFFDNFDNVKYFNIVRLKSGIDSINIRFSSPSSSNTKIKMNEYPSNIQPYYEFISTYIQHIKFKALPMPRDCKTYKGELFLKFGY